MLAEFLECCQAEIKNMKVVVCVQHRHLLSAASVARQQAVLVELERNLIQLDTT